MLELSKSELKQLCDSIEKLFHYIVPYVTTDTDVTVSHGGTHILQRRYQAPREISFSSTLYTRIDNCHGAGNCCRVPFDLVYTSHDRRRIENYSEEGVVEAFGEESAARFKVNRALLLESLICLDVHFKTCEREWSSHLWVKINTDINGMSGTTSCPYLFTGSDRYFCGVHLFKPLHCWYPHMVVRVNERGEEGDRPTITIGRMQYGRNHKFGCPVVFGEHDTGDPDALFDVGGGGPDYFQRQSNDDYEKLEWTAKSTLSLGFDLHDNIATSLHRHLVVSESLIRRALSSRIHIPIVIWRNDEAVTED